MIVSRMAKSTAQLWQQGIGSVHKLDEWTHGWLGLVASSAGEALRSDSAVTATAISYFSLFSLFPLILLSVAIANIGFGPLMDQPPNPTKAGVCCASAGAVVGPEY